MNKNKTMKIITISLCMLILVVSIIKIIEMKKNHDERQTLIEECFNDSKDENVKIDLLPDEVICHSK